MKVCVRVREATVAASTLERVSRRSSQMPRASSVLQRRLFPAALLAFVFKLSCFYYGSWRTKSWMPACVFSSQQVGSSSVCLVRREPRPRDHLTARWLAMRQGVTSTARGHVRLGVGTCSLFPTARADVVSRTMRFDQQTTRLAAPVGVAFEEATCFPPELLISRSA